MLNIFLIKFGSRLTLLNSRTAFFINAMRVNCLFSFLYFSIIILILISISLENILFSFFFNIFSDLDVNVNSSIFLFFYFSISNKNLLLNYFGYFVGLNYFSKFQNTSNWLFLLVYWFYYNFGLVLVNFAYFLNKLLFVVKKNLSSLVKINFFLIIIRKITYRHYWYPLFKRSSIFSYYRISRQRWTELKSEEINFLKY